MYIYTYTIIHTYYILYIIHTRHKHALHVHTLHTIMRRTFMLNAYVYTSVSHYMCYVSKER